MFENNVKLYTRINEHGPRAGADDPMESMFFYKHRHFVNLAICCKLISVTRFSNSFPLYKSIGYQI